MYAAFDLDTPIDKIVRCCTHPHFDQTSLGEARVLWRRYGRDVDIDGRSRRHGTVLTSICTDGNA